MKALRVLAAVILAAVAMASSIAQPVRTEIRLGGSKAGDNVFERQEDGTFSSTTSLDLAGTKLLSILTGRFTEGKLVEYRLEQSQGTAKTIVSWDGKKVTVEGAGPRREVPLAFDGEATFANFHPQLNASLMRALNRAELTKVRTLLIDGGVVLQVEGQSIPPLAIERQGRREVLVQVKGKVGQADFEAVLASGGELAGFRVKAQTFETVLEGYDQVFVDPVLQFKELSQPTFRVRREAKVAVPMRDGVTLVHDAAFPVGEGRYPTILMRTPYGRAAQMLEADWWARRGYVVVSQDVRGRGDSEGDWEPFLAERQDGVDTIEWIAKQPWSDGNVGMIGASYSGYVQWAAAVEKPAALKAIIPQVSPPDLMSNIPYDHGMFMLLPNLWWSRIVMDRQADMASATAPIRNMEALLKLPLTRIDDALLGRSVPFYDGWVNRRTLSDFKGSVRPEEARRVGIPTMLISGWFDGDGIGTKLGWQWLKDGRNDRRWLIYGPWSHAFNTTTRLGDVDFGPDSVLELNSLYLRFFDAFLKGKDVGMAKVPRARAFLTGANRWLELADWPDPTWKRQTLYLSAPGPANGPQSSGELVEKPVADQEPSRFLYNPAAVEVPKPIENLMATSQASLVFPLEPKDQGILLYRTAPLAEPLAVKGPVQIELHVSTTARDADFFAMLVDVQPDGKLRVIGAPGKLRLSYRDGNDRVVPVQPGRTYRIRLDHWDVAHEFAKGHRLGLIIGSDLFPQFARNLGLGEPNATATRMIAAAQTVFHDPRRPSKVTFYVAP